MTINTCSLKTFINSCDSYCVPYYVSEYVSTLSKSELINFYHSYKTASSYLIDDWYLIYKLRWILKEGYIDLSLSLFIELICNVENFNLDEIISECNFSELVNLYEDETHHI